MNSTARNLLLFASIVTMGVPVVAEAGRGGRSARVNPAQARAARTQSQRQQTRRVRPQRQRQNISLRGNQARGTVQAYKSSMESSIMAKATPPFALVPSGGATMTQTRSAHYKENRTAAFNVSGAKGGKLSLTALLPVSGHVGVSQAQGYAKSNQYNLVIKHGDGSVERLPKVKSTGLVTEKPLNLQLKPGKTTIQFWADGSAGVGGYKAGREIELNWSGN